MISNAYFENKKSLLVEGGPLTSYSKLNNAMGVSNQPSFACIELQSMAYAIIVNMSTIEISLNL